MQALPLQHKAIIVEGQIDCLRLIDAEMDFTVAALGTAFGESHVRELKQLGALEVTLLFDGDRAGKAAMSKVGDLFQKVGMEVKCIPMPEGLDPDSLVRQQGKEALEKLLHQGVDYLTFQIHALSAELSDSPAGKNELIAQLSKQIKAWDEPVMVHESLRRLARLTRVPEHMLGSIPPPAPRQRETFQINPSRILELDLLRWLLFMEREDFMITARHYLTLSHFLVPACQQIYQAFLDGAKDLLALAPEIEDEAIIQEIMEKKVNRDRAEAHFLITVQKLVDRKWLAQREKVKQKIDSGEPNDEKVLELVKEFDALGKKRKIVELCT